MTSPPAAASPSTRKHRTERRQADLRPANLAALIVLIVQFALGMGVNLYVTLPAAGHPGHASWFGNGALLALHAALGSGFTDKLTDGYSLGMALAFAVALACYAIGLFAASARKAVGDAEAPHL